MLLQVYHDSSQSDGLLTLCGVAATESVWLEFSAKWEAALRRHDVKRLHMVDLMSFNRDFSKSCGWNSAKRKSFINDLFNVMGSFRDPSYHLVARSCSVDLNDWRLVREKLPRVPSPEAICVNFCVGSLSLPPECFDEPKPVQLFFDRNERFMHTVRRVWERRRRQAGLFSQIRTIDTASSVSCPVQAADLLAWIVNRKKAHQEETFMDTLRMSLILMIEHPSMLYDLEAIFDHYPDGRLKPGPKELNRRTFLSTA